MSFVLPIFWKFSEMLHYIVIKQADTPVHNCDIGMPLLYKALRTRDDHVTTTWRPRDSLFDFPVFVRVTRPDFLEVFVRVSSCSNIKPFEVRGFTVHIIDKGWSSDLTARREAIRFSPYRKEMLHWASRLERSTQWNMNMRFSTWTIRILCWTSTLQTAARELAWYNPMLQNCGTRADVTTIHRNQ
jgi:hypothetical protein